MAGQILDQATIDSDAALADFVRSNCGSICHPVGTSEDGTRIQLGGRGRSILPCPWCRGAASGRCVGDAQHRARQYQPYLRHDRRTRSRLDEGGSLIRAIVYHDESRGEIQHAQTRLIHVTRGVRKWQIVNPPVLRSRLLATVPYILAHATFRCLRRSAPRRSNTSLRPRGVMPHPLQMCRYGSSATFESMFKML